jgi:hypothetical protein
MSEPAAPAVLVRGLMEGSPVLAVLEDSTAGAALIECAATLARTLDRELTVVHVQSAIALQAAALPSTLALAHAGADWAPFAPQDVERGWRAQAARLRALAAPIATRHQLRWSLRALRGEVAEVARALGGESDLLFVDAGATRLAAPAPAVQALGVLDDGSAAAARALQLAEGMARHMATHAATHHGKRWPKHGMASASAAQRLRPPPLVQRADALGALLQRLPAARALLLPRALADTPALWARLLKLGCPVLMVG